jgi:hypothetical protein
MRACLQCYNFLLLDPLPTVDCRITVEASNQQPTGANTMTTQQIRSIQSAIADCNRYIALEGARSADLRPAEIAKLLGWYIAHRAKLLAMLAAA